MKIISIVVIYLVECLKYLLGYSAFFSENIKKEFLVLVGALPGIVLLVFWPHIHFDTELVLVYGCLLINFFLLMKEKVTARLGRLIFLFIFSTGMDFIAEILFSALGMLQESDYYFLYYDYVCNSILCIVILIIINFVKYTRREKGYVRVVDLIKENIHYISIVMAVTILLAVAGLWHAQKYINIGFFSTFTLIISISAVISMVFIIGSAMYIRNLNHRLAANIRQIEELKRMQEKHYESLLKREEETRHYRHDMQNHLYCVQGFIEQKDYESLEKYVTKMQSYIHEIGGKNYDTGNKVLDMLTTYYLSLLSDDVQVTVKGKLSDALAADDVEICTIYGNLLQNAVEELQRNHLVDNAFININFTQGKKFSQIAISNSYVEDASISKKWFETKKQDERNHGMGLTNVKKILGEIDGDIEFNRENGVFHVTVTLKN